MITKTIRSTRRIFRTISIIIVISPFLFTSITWANPDDIRSTLRPLARVERSNQEDFLPEIRPNKSFVPAISFDGLSVKVDGMTLLQFLNNKKYGDELVPVFRRVEELGGAWNQSALSTEADVDSFISEGVIYGEKPAAANVAKTIVDVIERTKERIWMLEHEAEYVYINDEKRHVRFVGRVVGKKPYRLNPLDESDLKRASRLSEPTQKGILKFVIQANIAMKRNAEIRECRNDTIDSLSVPGWLSSEEELFYAYAAASDIRCERDQAIKIGHRMALITQRLPSDAKVRVILEQLYQKAKSGVADVNFIAKQLTVSAVPDAIGFGAAASVFMALSQAI